MVSAHDCHDRLTQETLLNQRGLFLRWDCQRRMCRKTDIQIVSVKLFPLILHQYHLQYPNVAIVLRDLVTLEQMKQLDRKDLDISFATHPSLAVHSEEE